jgi:competence protein ComEC
VSPVLPALGWLAGTLCLQALPELPSASAIGVAAALGAAFLLTAAGRRRSARSRGIALLAAAALAGFAWSAAWASARMSDALPVEWERQDIEVVGVIAELVQRTERGVRFAFDVEEVLTDGAVVPQRLLRSWYGKRPALRAPAAEDEEAAAASAGRPPAAG